ncbi:TPA: hypothetical protein N0F65_003595 [Lagenidium giganteum]|uniref:Tf2-1-like SH3-like domain-containing protein n=1 Tax=Lagenidium giganteum TaxID=4803 RepID=A0AAV2Z2P7_9STRA|nr:TPA: hypothetical protein N0F65_003595 [Lagenidium giganteum]
MMGAVFKKFNLMMRQKHRATLAYRPLANGKQEYYVQTVIWAIKMYAEDEYQKDWDEYAPRLAMALNTSINASFGTTPFYSVHGWDARTMLDAMVPPLDRITKEQLSTTQTEYEIGEYVWVFFNLVKEGMTRKLAQLWNGPYRIVEKVADHAYKVELENGTTRIFPIIHISRLKLRASSDERPTDEVEDCRIVTEQYSKRLWTRHSNHGGL